MRPSHVRSRPPRLRLAGIVVTLLALVFSAGTVAVFQESSAAALDHRLENAEFEKAVFRGGVHQPSVVTEDTQLAQRIYLVLDDETQEYVTIAATVRGLLTELGITLGDDRAVSHDLDAPIVANDRIVIAWIDTRTVVEETVVPFGTVEIEDRALARGERVTVTEGRDGAATTTFLIRLADGREVLRTEILSTVHTPPRDEVVKVARLASPTRSPKTTAPITAEPTTTPPSPQEPSVQDQAESVPEPPEESHGSGPTAEEPEPTNTGRPTTPSEPSTAVPPTTAPPTTAPPVTTPPAIPPPTTVPPTTTPPTSSQSPEPTPSPTTNPPKATPTATPTPTPKPTPKPTPAPTTKPPTQSPTPTPTVPSEPEIGPGIGRGTTPPSARALAKEMAAARGWGNDEYACLNVLWMRESSWNFRAANPGSTARGLPQAMMSIHFGQGWRTDPKALAYLRTPQLQIDWGFNYIAGRYGSPCAAKAFSEEKNEEGIVRGWY